MILRYSGWVLWNTIEIQCMDEPGILIPWLENEWNLNLTQRAGNEEIYRALANRINDLIQNDFQQLIQILYRADINENKLRNVLASNTGRDAGELIAELLIKRQLEKAESRKNNPPVPPENAEEKW
jgi:hypothetical protein